MPQLDEINSLFYFAENRPI